jgi:hypothetical protein
MDYVIYQGFNPLKEHVFGQEYVCACVVKSCGHLVKAMNGMKSSHNELGDFSGIQCKIWDLRPKSRIG